MLIKSIKEENLPRQYDNYNKGHGYGYYKPRNDFHKKPYNSHNSNFDDIDKYFVKQTDQGHYEKGSNEEFKNYQNFKNTARNFKDDPRENAMKNRNNDVS